MLPDDLMLLLLHVAVDRLPVKIHKERNGFVTYIDGDRLDVYRSQPEAEKAAKAFVKQFKGR